MAAPIPVKSWCILLFANFFSCYETQQLILGTGAATWWVTEPHCDLRMATSPIFVQFFVIFVIFIALVKYVFKKQTAFLSFATHKHPDEICALMVAYWYCQKGLTFLELSYIQISESNYQVESWERSVGSDPKHPR